MANNNTIMEALAKHRAKYFPVSDLEPDEPEVDGAIEFRTTETAYAQVEGAD